MRRALIASGLSSLLLWAAFFPLDLGSIAFFALVPWLMLVRASLSRRQRYVAAYFGAFLFFALATNWLRVADPMMYFSWAGLSLVLPFFWLLGLDVIRRFNRLGAPLALSVPVVWVALEYARMHFPTGFPFLKPLGLYQMIGFGWYFLGYTQQSFLSFIQVADIGGVYAVSFLVAAVNGLFADWAYRMGKVRQWFRVPVDKPGTLGSTWTGVIIATAAVGSLVVGSLVYGNLQLNHEAFTAGPRVAALQGSVPQGQKMLKGDELQVAYGKLHGQALSGNPKPDLVVWPETCFVGDWLEVHPEQAASEEFVRETNFNILRFSKIPFGVPVLLGLTTLEWENGKVWKYNSALFVSSKGKEIGRYDKMHLVPFGEYVPLKNLFPFLQELTPYKEDYSCRPGEHWTRFPLTTHDGRSFTFGCLICYEDSDPYLARRYVADEPVNFLVNISNDGWFDGTEEHEQHLAICRFRAVEARRSIVRSVNMGISAVIDPDGRIVELPRESWSASKKIETVVSAEVPIDGRMPFYASLGDWLPAGCWAMLLVGVVLSTRRKHVPET